MLSALRDICRTLLFNLLIFNHEVLAAQLSALNRGHNCLGRNCPGRTCPTQVFRFFAQVLDSGSLGKIRWYCPVGKFKKLL